MSWEIFHQVPARACLCLVLRPQTLTADHVTDLSNVHLCLFHKWIQLCAIIGWWAPEHLPATCLKTHPHTRNMCVHMHRTKWIPKHLGLNNYKADYHNLVEGNIHFIKSWNFLKKVKCITTVQMKHGGAAEIRWQTNHNEGSECDQYRLSYLVISGRSQWKYTIITTRDAQMHELNISIDKYWYLSVQWHIVLTEKTVFSPSL